METRVTETLVNIFLTVWSAEGGWTGTDMVVWSSVIAGSTILTGALMPTDIFINLAESARVARVTQTLPRTEAAAVNCNTWPSKNGMKNIKNKNGDHPNAFGKLTYDLNKPILNNSYSNLPHPVAGIH